MTAPLVALAGTLCPPGVFDPLAECLRGEVDVDAFPWLTGPGPWDVPSLADGVGDHVRQRYARQVLLCGHSTGGAIALQLAVTEPDLVAGLLLVDTGPHMNGHGDVDDILRRVREEWGDELRAAVLDRSFATPLAPADRTRMLAWATTVRQQAVYDVLASQRSLDFTAVLGRIAAPTVVLHGELDRARSVAEAYELAAGIPHAQLRLVTAGHTPVYETPEEAASAVRELLRYCRAPECLQSE
ncbi:MAG: alpha/beta hydrolase [Blastococcus sp.]|nr:alpha/beta hydrolase [Blastococcus sp.]